MTEIVIGDKVQWTHISSGRSTLSMSLREGTVTSIDGALAMVQPYSKKSRPVQVALARLRKIGQKSQITEFIEGVREAHYGSKQGD